MNKKIAVIILLTLLVIINILPVYAQDNNSEVPAKVITNDGIEEVKKEDGKIQKVQKVTVRILEGEYKEEEYPMEYVLSENIEDTSSNSELKEKERILVEVEEKEGEVANIYYKETVNTNYILYVVLVISVILLFIVGRKSIIKPIIIYLLTISLASFVFILSIRNSWNLIWTSGIITLIITVCNFIIANGINKKTFIIILCTILGIAISGTAIYILSDMIELTDANIRISNKFVNIKEVICGVAILFSSGICNSIALIHMQKIFSTANQPYKTKSDNIIEGQRSLKL